MPDAMIRELARLEYDVVAIDAQLDELQQKLRRVAGRLPSCADAAWKVRRLQAQLRRLLSSLDDDISAALQSHEHDAV